MTRRFDYDTAEKISLALLTRAAFGTAAGMETALRIGTPLILIAAVFHRFPAETRIDIIGSAGSMDRRGHDRPTTKSE